MAGEIFKVSRDKIGHFMNVTPEESTASYKRINMGVSGLSIDYNPETSESHYIGEKTGTTDITGYKPSSAVDMECIKGDGVYDFVNNIRRNRYVLSDCYTDIINVDLYDGDDTNGYWAEKQPVSITINSYGGDQPDPPKINYTINYRGDAVIGTYKPSTDAFTPA